MVFDLGVIVKHSLHVLDLRNTFKSQVPLPHAEEPHRKEKTHMQTNHYLAVKTVLFVIWVARTFVDYV